MDLTSYTISSPSFDLYSSYLDTSKTNATKLKVYETIEPSARLNIVEGLLLSNRVKGGEEVDYSLILLDNYAYLNNKLDSDMKKILNITKYYIEIYKSLNMNIENIKLSSELINKNPNEYWLLVMDIARRFDLKRILNCNTSMGYYNDELKLSELDINDKKEEKNDDNVESSRIMYPCMQCAEPFYLKADCIITTEAKKCTALLSVDYSKLEVPEIVAKKYKTPALLVTETLLNLKNPSDLSFADAESIIFMDDDASDVKKKINRAFCPPNIVANNPVLDYCKKILLKLNGKVEITRSPENAFLNFSELEADYLSGALHPGDLKSAVIKALNEFLEPTRVHLQKADVKKLAADVKKYFK